MQTADIETITTKAVLVGIIIIVVDILHTCIQTEFARTEARHLRQVVMQAHPIATMKATMMGTMMGTTKVMTRATTMGIAMAITRGIAMDMTRDMTRAITMDMTREL